jgi:hypothetical protein
LRIPGGVTHTYAVLEISAAAFAEIKEKLERAGYEDQFHQDREHGIVIDMHGIAVAKSDA